MGGIQRVQARRRPRLGGEEAEEGGVARWGWGRAPGTGASAGVGAEAGVGVGGERRGAARAGLRRCDGGRESGDLGGKEAG